MTRAAVLFAVALFAAPLVAQEEVYLYVKDRDAAGDSVRYKLECLDAKCKVGTKAGKREFDLTEVQKKELLDALQAESKNFFVAVDPARSQEQTKLKFRYDTPVKRLEIERRLPGEKPVALTPEILRVIKMYFDLDLSTPAAQAPDAGKAPVGPGLQPGAG